MMDELSTDFRFDTVEEAIADIKAGKMIILSDDADRENEGDLVCAASLITPEIINFMATYGRGLICLSLDSQRVKQLDLPLMVQHNETEFGTNFTISIEAATGVTTGISAADRARTIQAAMELNAKPSDLHRPGHIFPLLAKDGGVLERAGQTEGSVDLTRLAGLPVGGVICEILKDDGSMARYPDLRKFADKHDLKFITIADLIQYRKQNETLVKKMAEASLPTAFGNFRIIAFQSISDENDYIALVKGQWEKDEPILVRVHSQCLTGDVFGSFRCDCGEQLYAAMKQVEAAGKGIILYLPQEGRGIGLINKIKAYLLQDEGADTVEANNKLGFSEDLRDYGIGAQILSLLGVTKMKLLTNNPKKIIGIQGHDLEVVERVPLETNANPSNEIYLRTKKHKMGHLLQKL